MSKRKQFSIQRQTSFEAPSDGFITKSLKTLCSHTMFYQLQSAEIQLTLLGTKNMAIAKERLLGEHKTTNVLQLRHTYFLHDIVEILVCPQVIHKEVIQWGYPYKAYWVLLFAHALLHAVGHHHDDATQELQHKQLEAELLQYCGYTPITWAQGAYVE